VGDGERLRRLPAWVWLGLIVIASAAVRLWLVRDMRAPFVFVDELIYSELAKSLADGNGYMVREVPASGYSLLYPALIAPAYWLFDVVPSAYAAAKSIGALTMSLAAIPTFLIARRVVRPSLALLAAALAVAVPSMAYTATITTESLFYPVALTVAWLLLRYLEHPGWARLVWLLALVAVAFATRAQSLAFVPAIATAPALLALLRGRVQALRPFVPLYVLLAAGSVLVVVGQAVRGRSPTDLLGAYSIVGEGSYDVGSILRFWLWHVEELDLYAGVVPVLALLLLLGLGRTVPERVQEHLAATVALAVWSSLAVAMFASRFASDRVQDRYLFFLVPLLVVALLAWVELGAPRPRTVTAAAAIVALGLPLLFPYTRFIGEPAKSDTLGLIPLWTANEHLILDRYWVTVALAGAALVALFLLVPPRVAVAVPLVLLALFAIFSKPVWSGPHGFVRAGSGALFQGIRGVARDWVDRSTPAGSEVVALWTGHADRFTVNQNEFFNRRVGHVYYVDQPTPGGVGETKVVAGRDGVYRDADGHTVDVRYALLDGSVTPDGVVVARDDQLGTTLWRLTGPLSSRATVKGLYADGNWSGPTATWTLLRCRPGTLTAAVHSDPSLFTSPQTVVAVSSSDTASVRFRPDEHATVRVRVRPRADGTCTVRFRVAPTAVPADVIPGSTDTRRLGVHFDAFAYEPTL
jgi:dolichyl-phosphate-mannose-protein mannosyltransferase